MTQPLREDPAKDAAEELPPAWVSSVAQLDLSRLADEFVARIQPDARKALALWDAALPRVPVTLRLALGRLVEGRLDNARLAALQQSPAGCRFVFQRRLDRRAPATMPLVPFMTPTLAYDSYAALVTSFGSPAARRAVRSRQLVLLGLRRESSTLANHGRGSYDDHIVVLNGVAHRGRAQVFPACTEPGAQYAQRSALRDRDGPGGDEPARLDDRYEGIGHRQSQGADADGDGIKDLGRLVAGTYEYFEKAGGFLRARAFQVRQAQHVERDTDGDGWFTARDRSRIDIRGAGTTMYIHRGGPLDDSQANTWSAGCQTIPGPLYPRFLEAVGHPSSFFYVLVDTVRA